MKSTKTKTKKRISVPFFLKRLPSEEYSFSNNTEFTYQNGSYLIWPNGGNFSQIYANNNQWYFNSTFATPSPSPSPTPTAEYTIPNTSNYSIGPLFILSIFLLIFNLILCFYPVPYLGLPLGIITLCITGLYTIFDTSVPANPLFSLMVAVVALVQIVIDIRALLTNKETKT